MPGLRNLCLVFTGQGSQRLGMTSSLEANWPKLMKNLYDEANETLKFNLHKIMHDGPNEMLTKTSIAQPAIVLHSYAITQILEKEIGFQINHKSCDNVIGHSVGEYSAIVATKGLTFSQAIELVHLRGKTIENGMKQYNQPTSMAALLPVSTKDALEIVQYSSAKTKQICEVANYNSKRQIVISGHSNAIQEAIKYAKEKKRVKKAILLNVSAPFHCYIFNETGITENFATCLDNVNFNDLTVPIISNVNTKETNSGNEIRELLKQQISLPVRWTNCLEYFINKSLQKNVKRGKSEAEPQMNIIECGYGGVLAGLIRQNITPKDRVAVASLGTAKEIQDFIKENIQKEDLYATY